MQAWAKRAHPFFWGACLMLAPAVAAAAVAGTRAPGYALHSQWVRRLEVGLAVFAGLYVLVLVLWLAYQGRSVERAELPGGAGIGLPDPDLDAAAAGFEDFRAATDARIATLEDTIDLLRKSTE
jgi:hypothetical protein